MKDSVSTRQHAIILMREALTLLDEAGDELVAARLKATIDIAEHNARTNSSRSSLENKLNRSDTHPPADPVLIQAMGGALALLGTVIEKQEATSLRELADLLGIYAAATYETAPEEGLVLAGWSAMLRDVADAQRRS